MDVYRPRDAVATRPLSRRRTCRVRRHRCRGTLTRAPLAHPTPYHVTTIQPTRVACSILLVVILSPFINPHFAAVSHVNLVVAELLLWNALPVARRALGARWKDPTLFSRCYLCRAWGLETCFWFCSFGRLGVIWGRVYFGLYRSYLAILNIYIYKKRDV